ncbi:MAG: hypothetical protein KJ947_21430 [Alphaproteobacteria bacterium]|nr:hypothetical protein [Alphaproteobacteria bacterium]MBU1552109.1 hypothetical protein [Alphaproteobacteria bacterium]MBU2336366.1 hypothetical protein [Alphaproteobacteria bacterium]MBU2388211.1 hypothetical protein [Alphaproteobacteria bacterium]|tara:strand:+ start:1062 stop:1445 length:384 start_codon:yes stop_codon:yes gene_type:complete
MPFYLVTHQSLVEADNDQDAALKALEKIGSSDRLEFKVKLDETTITHVAIAGRRQISLPSTAPDLSQAPDEKPAVTEPTVSTAIADHCPTPASPPTRQPDRPHPRTAAGVALFLGGLVLITFLLATL